MIIPADGGAGAQLLSNPANGRRNTHVRGSQLIDFMVARDGATYGTFPAHFMAFPNSVLPRYPEGYPGDFRARPELNHPHSDPERTLPRPRIAGHGARFLRRRNAHSTIQYLIL